MHRRKNTDHLCTGLCLSNAAAVLPATAALYYGDVWLTLACLLAGFLSGLYHYYASHLHCMTGHGSSRQFSIICHVGDWAGVLTLAATILPRIYADFYLPPLALTCLIVSLAFMFVSERPDKLFDPDYTMTYYYTHNIWHVLVFTSVFLYIIRV